MNTKDILNLMINSTNSSPHTGKLPKKDNVLAAISLVNLFLDFADKGYSDEAMDIDSEQWKEVIGELEILYED